MKTDAYTTQIIIIGAGASGLMAACAAAEAGLPGLVLERRHRPGLKLLLCGNNRCNISHAGTADSLQQDYGAPVGGFLSSALQTFPPSALKNWFESHSLPVKQIKDRYYPKTEKADDVLHVFTDVLRDREFPLILNSPVKKIERLPQGGFRVITDNLVLESPRLLLATGGASYPKTGSVGDGQQLAESLGHHCEPLRAGLVGIETATDWLNVQSPKMERNFQSVTVTVEAAGIGSRSFSGNLLAEGEILRGSAIFDAMRFVARQQLPEFKLKLDLFPETSANVLASSLNSQKRLGLVLNSLGLDFALADQLAESPEIRPLAGKPDELSRLLKQLPILVKEIRPLKEAIVTVGGVSLSEVNNKTMESKLVPGLYFAGELLDVDGPTGGYNLHAAFATARTAIAAIVRQQPHSELRQVPSSRQPVSSSVEPPSERPRFRKPWEKHDRGDKEQDKDRDQDQANGYAHSGKKGGQNYASRSGNSGKSAWGKDFWKDYMKRGK